jgi:hypothetical protein
MASKEPSLTERLQTAAKAKKAMFEKLREKALANAPLSAARQAERVETAKAREVRTAERASAKRADAERKAADRAAAIAAQAIAVKEESARKEAERVSKAEADEALKKLQKAERDARYAARKSRQR